MLKRLAITMMAACLPALCTPASSAEIRVAFAISDDIFLSPVFAAERLGLFRDADIQLRRLNLRGADTIQQALKSGQADIIDASGPAAAQAFPNGAGGKLIATAANGFYGWTVAAREDRSIPSIRDLAGKMVGVSTTHSLSDMAAQLAAENNSIKFDIVSLGAGSIVPELRAGKVEAIITSALLGLREVSANRARILFDLGADKAPFLVSGYVASTQMIETRQRDLRAFVAATSQALTHMQANRRWSIDLLKEYARISDNGYAELVYDAVIRNMDANAQVSPESLKEALELAARAWKSPELAATPVAPLYTDEFITAGQPPNSQ